MLKEASLPTYVRAERVNYSASGSMSVLLKEKAHTGLLFPIFKDALIKAVKAVDSAVIGVESIEHWQRLKVHRLSVKRYTSEGIELLQREIETSTDIQLKAKPRWLISKAKIEERASSGGKANSTIVITVGSEKEAKRLCAQCLKLGKGARPVEKFWEQGPRAICPKCGGIRHDRFGNCGGKGPRCTICAEPHLAEDHKCKVKGCTTSVGRPCIHDTAKCINCG